MKTWKTTQIATVVAALASLNTFAQAAVDGPVANTLPLRGDIQQGCPGYSVSSLNSVLERSMIDIIVKQVVKTLKDQRNITVDPNSVHGFMTQYETKPGEFWCTPGWAGHRCTQDPDYQIAHRSFKMKAIDGTPNGTEIQVNFGDPTPVHNLESHRLLNNLNNVVSSTCYDRISELTWNAWNTSTPNLSLGSQSGCAESEDIYNNSCVVPVALPTFPSPHAGEAQSSTVTGNPQASLAQQQLKDAGNGWACDDDHSYCEHSSNGSVDYVSDHGDVHTAESAY